MIDILEQFDIGLESVRISIKGRICLGVVFEGNGSPEAGDNVFRVFYCQHFARRLLAVHGYGS
ncbi:MAG: hypothetical protein ACYC6G_19375 [Desulfobaccales bacterium]